MGSPNPPRKPVVAGLTASIASIAGPETTLSDISPKIMAKAMVKFLLFDFVKFFKIYRTVNMSNTIKNRHKINYSKSKKEKIAKKFSGLL